MVAAEMQYFKKNVPYRVGVRMNLRDNIGQVLSDEFPYVSVEKDKIREFLQANKYGIKNGLIVEIGEPPLEIITPNTITDEQAEEIVKNFFQLKRRLAEITAEPALLKLLEYAKSGKRSEKTIKLIMERYEEISPSGMIAVE